MTPEEKYELFDKYCSGELSVTEKEQLDILVKEDPALKEELKLYAEIHKHLDISIGSEEEQASLANNLKNIGDAYFKGESENKKTKVIRMPSWIYAAAASVAIIFGVYFFNQGSPSYKDYAVIPELTISERGTEDETAKNAEDAFNNKLYNEAEKHLFELLTVAPKNATYKFYYGITLLEQDRHSEASTVFKSLTEGNSVYKHKAIWFEALNQLKQKRYQECSRLLKTIPSEAEDYHQAQKLLKKLD